MTDGGPAYPLPGGASDCTVQKTHLGMSLRDYFATQALHGMLAHYGTGGDNHRAVFKYRADLAYKFADAMLAVRDCPQDTTKPSNG